MKRRRFLKYLSSIPFVGSLVAVSKAGRPERQPETLQPGQVWKGKSPFYPDPDLEVYYILICTDGKGNDLLWLSCEVANNRQWTTLSRASEYYYAEEIRKLTYIGHISQLNK